MYLTKSQYVLGCLCPKMLWYQCNEPSKLPAGTEADDFRRDEGTAVGELARSLYPSGRLVEGDFKGLPDETRKMMALGCPLFEAAFSAGQGYCKVDILVPSGDGWELIEVKSSNSCKKEHILDVAFQLWVLENAGVAVSRAFVVRLNPSYVRSGELDLDALFVREDVTAQARELLIDVPAKVRALLRMVGGMRPEPEAVHLCSCSYCAVGDVDVVVPGDVVTLVRGGVKILELLSRGVTSLAEIPADFPLTEAQRVQVEAARSGRVVDREKITEWLSRVEYPRYYFDFETFMRALPPFDLTRTWQQIPFQFSVHVELEDGSLMHHEFLGSSGDPRSSLIAALQCLGDVGSIVVYSSFEEKRLRELAELDEGVAALIPRLVDLGEPFAKRWWYDARQNGSWSIKKVLPCFCEMDYSSLEIGSGDVASVAFVKRGSDPAVRKALLEYCKMDTLAMVEVMRGLGKKG